ncbi:MAG: DUF3494 domain-containing protein [Burkholderiales bacterium]|nr:DUF3494 domain-containing protein [Burkholderiales bacterium]
MKISRCLSILSCAVIATLYGASPALAGPLLGPDLSSFTVLGSSTVTNTGTSTISGNVGVSPGTSITGFPPGVVTGGTVQAHTASAIAAQSQLTTAITGLGSLGPGTALGANLAGLTLTPGVYTVAAGTTNLSGTLTLNGQGNANAAWVFQMPSTLITSSNSVVNVINTGSGAGVYWNVGSSATIAVNTTFIGNILALASITMNTSATDLCGRALASTAAVTLDTNNLSGTCTSQLAGSNGLSGGLSVSGTTVSFLPYAPVNVPEPSTLPLLGLGFVGLGLFGLRRTVETNGLQRIPMIVSA